VRSAMVDQLPSFSVTSSALPKYAVRPLGPAPLPPPDALAIDHATARMNAHAWRWSTCGPLRPVRDWAICSHSIMLHLDQNTKELDPGSQPTDKACTNVLTVPNRTHGTQPYSQP